jgi:hypothetical protein
MFVGHRMNFANWRCFEPKESSSQKTPLENGSTSSVDEKLAKQKALEWIGSFSLFSNEVFISFKIKRVEVDYYIYPLLRPSIWLANSLIQNKQFFLIVL